MNSQRPIPRLPAALATLALFAATTAPAPAAQPWALFDGATFNGWEGDTAVVWRIEGGAITAGSLRERAPRNEFLTTTKRYGDFELRLKFKITGEDRVNAGVQFRTERIPDHHEVVGYQADIGPRVDGHLYDESRRRRMLASPSAEVLKAAQAAAGKDGWQSYRIRAEGARVQLWLNGVQTVDYEEEDATIPRTGVIALQIHGGMQAVIAYKDIVIEELTVPPGAKDGQPGKKKAEASGGSTPPAVTNHADGSTVRYPVILLRGTVNPGAERLEVRNGRSPRGAQLVEPAVHEGRFKALVDLAPGRNVIGLRTGRTGDPLLLRINYEPQTNPYYVRVIWMTDASGQTDFAAPSASVPQDYAARLRTAAQLMQTFTAEKMHDLGHGRRTFRLERDGDGRVVVHTWKAPGEAADYRDLGRSYGRIARWLNRDHPDRFAKNMVLAAFTRKDPETGQMLAHTALGGGNLGLFGSGSVFSWPRDIAGATGVFHDAARVDPSNVHDDSAGRNTYWGLASTTIGATLHEMGHTFGLPHCKDRYGIMTRGFDHFNRAFTFFDPPAGRSSRPRYFPPEKEAYFAPVSASYLRWSRWFQPDEVRYRDDDRPRITFDPGTGSVTVTAEAGVPWVGLWVGPDIYAHKEFDRDNPPKTVGLTRAEIDELLDGKTLSRVTAIGANGRGARADPGRR